MYCTRCGTENPESFRFCGMCGASLGQITPATVEETVHARSNATTSHRMDRESQRKVEITEERGLERVVGPSSARAVSGPSFLGLNNSDAPAEVSYLLEEEPHLAWGRVLGVLLVISLLAGAGWALHHYGGVGGIVARLRGAPARGANGESNTAAAVDRSQSALAEAGETSNASQTQSFDMEDGKAIPKSQPEHAAAGSAVTKDEPNATGSTATEADLAPVNGDTAAKKAEDLPKQATPQQEAETTGEVKRGGEQAVHRAAATSASETKKIPLSGAEQASDAAQKRAAGADDGTAALAEKYLYGKGVPQDCDRAVAMLRPAAESNNLKARTLLGTMYATGHCVPRDLPHSYRYFALALRQQPNNPWLEKNLQSIWNQMSSPDKQTAVKLAR